MDTRNWPGGGSRGAREAAAQNLATTVSPRPCVWGVARAPREKFVRQRLFTSRATLSAGRVQSQSTVSTARLVGPGGVLCGEH